MPRKEEETQDQVQALLIRENLVPFKTTILAAVPGKSLNNRNYNKDVLQRAAPFYKDKPFMMDHSMDSDKVLGIFTDGFYGIGKTMKGEDKEGLWIHGIGLMPRDLFDKIHGTPLTPPLLRGFSIGGGAEGDHGINGWDVSKFEPEEGSLTPFPGIPAAHIAQIEAIRESYRQINKKEESNVKETKTQDATIMDIPLDEAEKTAKIAVKEGQIPTSPDSQFKTGIPVGSDLTSPSYKGHPDIVKVYPDTNPVNGWTPTPPTDISHVSTVTPQPGSQPPATATLASTTELKCPKCGADCKDDADMADHMKKAHPDEVTDRGTPTDFGKPVNAAPVTATPVPDKPNVSVQGPQPNTTVMAPHPPEPSAAAPALGTTTTEIGDKRATVETKGFTAPNQMAPMEISSKQGDVVARAKDLLLEEQQKGNYGFMPPDRRAWIRAQMEILREQFGRD